MSPRAFAFDSQGPSVGGDFSKWWGFCSTPSYPKAFSFLKRTILFPSILLLPYMDTWECVFTSDLPTTQLVLDNYNSWLAISWKQQIPCLAQHPPPKSSTLPLPLTPSVHHPQPLLPPSFIHNINSEWTRRASLHLTRFAAVSCDKNPTLIPDSESRIYNSILI